MKKIAEILILLLVITTGYAQHSTKLTVDYNPEGQLLSVHQELTYINSSEFALSSILLNDWLNAYSDKNTPLGKRFADEFVRSFHVASAKERGGTLNLTVYDTDKFLLQWCRDDEKPDLVEIFFREPLQPGASKVITLTYQLKIPSSKFTGYGYTSNGAVYLKDCFLLPAVFEKGTFLHYSNLDLDDQYNAPCKIDLMLRYPSIFKITTDLELQSNLNGVAEFSSFTARHLNLAIEKETTFSHYKNSQVTVVCNLDEKRINEIQKAVVIDKIVNYVTETLGKPTQGNIMVSQVDYEKNPFYGLNQLPSFIRPFPDDFVYEIKFLKTYLNSYLKSAFNLDPREDNWIFDALQVYVMMRYIDSFYPDIKVAGSLSKAPILRSYRIFSLDFNQQYSYYYMLMARKNLDQTLNSPKDELIKFNEKIASKYRAGLSLKYLEDFIGLEALTQSISDFVAKAKSERVTSTDFKQIIQSNSSKNCDWFFETIINSRKIIDYKFEKVSKENSVLSYSLKDRTGNTVPVPVYGIKDKKPVFKQWIDVVKKDSIYIAPTSDVDKLVINYENIVPEFNQRNNWKNLKPFWITNRPIRFRLVKDLEDPFYNQIMFVPEITYNFYDGVILGLTFNNKSFLDKPFTFDLAPAYSTKAQSLSGSFSLSFNNYIREGKIFAVRYGLSGSYFRYAPDATYKKFTPYLTFKLRPKNLRDNHFRTITFREVYVNREPSNYVVNTFDEKYAVFDARYFNSRSTITQTIGFMTNLQVASAFNKMSGEANFRKLFNNNRQLNIRLYAGAFLKNNLTTNYFDFALERPTDYLFDYSFLGRSESTGFFRQQYITAEGGFKSRFENQLANHWISSMNVSGSIWNWIEAYADFGLLKNKSASPVFMYDSGIRLNLVTDYFELYFPIYSNKGWEISQPSYPDKIRFVFTFSPKSLAGLFTRKWL